MYNELNLVQKGNKHYIDSREVAELIGKWHDHLLRDIRNYAEIIRKNGLPNFGESEFFKESSFVNSQNKVMPCYLISKLGAEVIANKLTGEKGVLFTAAYVSKFNMMETHLRAEWEKSQVLKPTLSDCNDTAKIVIDQLKRTGATTYRILDFLSELYEPLGLAVLEDGEFDDIPQTYTALQIAWLCGVYSLYGNPHAHAVSCIINENLFISDKHRYATSDNYASGITGGMRYDEYALESVKQWIADCKYPREIYSDIRTYHVVYRKK
jgi:Rha family phage regulatory protein